MIKLYDVVRIKDTGITGIVVNISSMNGKTVYTVENNRRGRTGILVTRNDNDDSFGRTSYIHYFDSLFFS